MESGAHHNLAMVCNRCSSGGGEVTYSNGAKVSVRNTPNVTDGEQGVVFGRYQNEHFIEVDFDGKAVFRGGEYCAQTDGRVKDEKIKEDQEVVKSRSTRHALERVLKAVQLHLPPDGISEREAMGRIIEAVDPMPDDFDSEKCIKEVMELVEEYGQTESNAVSARFEGATSKDRVDNLSIAISAFDAIESKLRELIQ